MRDDLGYHKAQWPKPSQLGIAADSPDIQDSSENGGFFATLAASLNIGFGSIVTELRKTRKAIAQSELAPVFYRSVIPVPLNGAGFGIARMAGPDQGHYWYVRSLVVGGTSDPSVPIPGRADVFVSAADLRFATQLSQVGIGEWHDFTATLPSVAPYSKGELTLRFNEELYVFVTGGTPSTQYTVACSVQDFQESNNAQDWSV